MAMESAKVASASAVAYFLFASASFVVAPTAIVASFARFENVAMAFACFAYLFASACLTVSCMVDSASIAARSLPASRLALCFKFFCCSSSVDGSVLCHVEYSIKSFACLVLSGSCLSSITSISGVRVTGSLMRLPLELEACATELSLNISLPLPSLLCSSAMG